MEEFTFEPIDDQYTEEIKKNSVAPVQSNPELIVHPSRCVLTFRFQRDFDRLYNFEVYPDDVWIVTFPKSGTTWTQEMVWLLMNNFDFNTAKTVPLRFRCPFLELESIQVRKEDDGPILTFIDASKSKDRPRCIKSHLPKELLPKALWTVKPKIIYVSRDPRDVAISYYHHYRLWNGYQGTLENFTEVFLADRLVYSPYWPHNISFWNMKNEPYLLLNSFEEMKKDLGEVIRKTAKFLGVKITDQGVEDLKQHLSFNSMKNNNNVNFLDITQEIKKKTNVKDENLVFMRKGESGGWAKTYSNDSLDKFEKWTKKQLADTQYTEYPFSSK